MKDVESQKQKQDQSEIFEDEQKEFEQQMQEDEDIELLQKVMITNQRKLNQTKQRFYTHSQHIDSQSEQQLTYHRLGLQVYDCKAEIKVQKSKNQQSLNQQRIDEFYKTSLYTIIDEPKTNQLKNVKKLAPNVQLENCSKHEAKIFQKLPTFPKRKVLNPEYDLYVPDSESVILFNSRFDSGNLQQAIRQTEQEYVLYLDFDTNSQSHSQWYYFSCMGRKRGQTIRINIINLIKVDSLYNKGMQICTFSKKKFENMRIGWHRSGFNIKYTRNKFNTTYIPTKELDMVDDDESLDENEEVEQKTRVHYSLSFQYTFEYDDDIVFFSHFYPYTHRDLKHTLATVMQLPKINSIMRVDNLCNTLGGNPCYILTITQNMRTYLTSEDEQHLLKKSDAARAMLKKKLEIYEARQKARDASLANNNSYQARSSQAQIKDLPNTQDPDQHDSQTQNLLASQSQNLLSINEYTFNPHMNQYLNDHKKKRAIVLTARVHPGESNSSFIMEGIIKFLTSNSKEAKVLRANYIFKIVPMLNPDGVIYGNYRCSLLGVDLNRRWTNPSKILHPTIHYTKQIIKMLDLDRTIDLFTDIHGHSRKYNVFMYACAYPEVSLDSRQNALIKVLPSILNDRIDAFSLKDCKFALEKEKESTARVVLFKELNIVNSYTMEASFFGTEPEEPAQLDDDEDYDQFDGEEEKDTSQLIQQAHEKSFLEPTIKDDPIYQMLCKKGGDTIHHEGQSKPQVFFTPRVLCQVGFDFCRSLYHFMNPLQVRKQVNQIMNQARKRKFNQNNMTTEKSPTKERSQLNNQEVLITPSQPQTQNDKVNLREQTTSQSPLKRRTQQIQQAQQNNTSQSRESPLKGVNRSKNQNQLSSQAQSISLIANQDKVESFRRKIGQKSLIVNSQKIKKLIEQRDHSVRNDNQNILSSDRLPSLIEGKDSALDSHTYDSRLQSDISKRYRDLDSNQQQQEIIELYDTSPNISIINYQEDSSPTKFQKQNRKSEMGGGVQSNFNNGTLADRIIPIKRKSAVRQPGFQRGKQQEVGVVSPFTQAKLDQNPSLASFQPVINLNQSTIANNTNNHSFLVINSKMDQNSFVTKDRYKRNEKQTIHSAQHKSIDYQKNYHLNNLNNIANNTNQTLKTIESSGKYGITNKKSSFVNFPFSLLPDSQNFNISSTSQGEDTSPYHNLNNHSSNNVVYQKKNNLESINISSFNIPPNHMFQHQPQNLSTIDPSHVYIKSHKLQQRVSINLGQISVKLPQIKLKQHQDHSMQLHYNHTIQKQQSEQISQNTNFTINGINSSNKQFATQQQPSIIIQNSLQNNKIITSNVQSKDQLEEVQQSSKEVSQINLNEQLKVRIEDKSKTVNKNQQFRSIRR
eukprot:403373989